ncbi:hypothetical protein [Parasitella parasitica]|uniref:Xylanolytic transcriptional activator regulatory domain-containing protein n=1 Tax=Parasitella parasitica TaxID=35722 RepID=A0A0B7MY89_9FUNG|nr:hypothetical protein [Parasitella parasitica]
MPIQRRRKCERIGSCKSCQRCLEANRKCTTQYIYAHDDSSAYEEEQEQEIYEQIKHLEAQIKALEVNISQEKALIKQESRWDLQYANGELRLITEIKSLEELMMYGKAAIRYLSPFGNMLQAKPAVFERISFVRQAMQIVSKSFHQNNDPESTSSPKAISKRFSVGMVALWDPHLVIGRLVLNYFSCFNDVVPILHEPSFMEHYENLQNPMQDAIVLAMCTSSAISTCKHNVFNSYEKRHFSEYFYDLAMEKLVDMFDDPNKSLESVIVVNLLIPFMVTTSRVADSFKWSSMASVLISNLQQENPDFACGGPHLPTATRIKYSIIHRNSVQPFNDLLRYDLRTQCKQHDAPFDILPNEPAKTRNTFKVFNQMLRLSSHPVFVAVLSKIRRLAMGDATVDISLEEVVRYEEAVAEWWLHLPQKLKICAQPFSLTRKMIEHETSASKIVMMSYVYINSLNIYGCLIQPKSRRDGYDVVSDKAIYMTLSAIATPVKILVRCIDSLMILLQVQDESIAKLAKSKLNDHMHALTKRVSPDHRVSPSASPFSVLTVAPPGPTPPITELYKNYPLPREALIYDVVRTIVEQNTENLAALKSL